MSIFRVVGFWPSFGIEVFGVRMPLRHIRDRKGEERAQTLTYYFVAEGGGCLSLQNVGICV